MYIIIVCSLEERQLAEAALSGYVGPADMNSQPAATSSDSVPVPEDTALLGEVDKKSANKCSPTKLPPSPHRGRTSSRPGSSVSRLDFYTGHFSTFYRAMLAQSAVMRLLSSVCLSVRNV